MVNSIIFVSFIVPYTNLDSYYIFYYKVCTCIYVYIHNIKFNNNNYINKLIYV